MHLWLHCYGPKMQTDHLPPVVSIRQADISNNAIAEQADPFMHGSIMLMQLVEELDMVSVGRKGMIQQGGCLGNVFGGEFADFHGLKGIKDEVFALCCRGGSQGDQIK